MSLEQRRHPLGPDEVEDFHRRGYAGPFKVYEPDEIAACWRRERIRLMDRGDAAYQLPDGGGAITNIANYDRHLDNAFLAEHVCRPEIVDRIASILGPDVLCWRTEFFPKYPGDEGTDWHQADTFAHASGAPQIVWPGDDDFGGTITAWCAFTPATVDTACLQFIPGTHRTKYYDESKGLHYSPERYNNTEKHGVRRGFFGYDYRQLQIDPDWSPDESRAISMELQPGEVVLFWSTLMHASHPHAGHTRQMRLGFASRYVPTSVRVYPGTDTLTEYDTEIALDRYGAVLVSGRDHYGHNRIATTTTTGRPFRTLPALP
ncbi:chlorinating enzyme [Nocardia sp. NPDC004068]|uniref:chlorinating enzyme n=1 Tax=Nocardia sp. NPDC004068 TaxID=3364303 RepID=UPI0036ACD4D0